MSNNSLYARDDFVKIDKQLQVCKPPHLITGTVVPPADVLFLPVISAEVHAQGPKVFRFEVLTFLSTEGCFAKERFATLLSSVKTKS